MERVVEPEWLDEMPPHDARAIHSRRDIRRLNGFMGNMRLIAHELRTAPKPARVLDIGAGDGQFSIALARRLAWRGVEFVLIDRNDAISERARAAFNGVHCSSVFRRCDVLVDLDDVEFASVGFANLFLHHFTTEQLTKLLRDISKRCNVFVACEPRRSPLALFASRCVALLGCNAVTRHDAVVSVRAGFRDTELSQLWPQREQWLLNEREAGLFSHLFLARRL